MRRTVPGATGALFVVLFAAIASSQEPPPAPAPSPAAPGVIDVRPAQPQTTASSFDALWASFVAAERKGDEGGAAKAMQDILRLRIERNVRSLEELALARMARGVDALKKGERDKAEAEFKGALALDPFLPDGHFGLAVAALQRGPLGILPALKEIVAGVSARLPTENGRYDAITLVSAAALLTLFLTIVVLGLGLLVRYGGLLFHDIEEAVSAGRNRWLAIGIFTALLLLPTATFQGYGWLPLWWLALLFIYMKTIERVVVLLVLALALAVGPLVTAVEQRVLTEQNPLFHAGLTAAEGGPDSRALALLEAAAREKADDRDYAYMSAVLHKKAGRYEDAAAIYRDLLRANPTDGIALNNLGNLEFAAGDFVAAIARYKKGLEGAASPSVTATLQYNLSLAHLQKFDYKEGQEARSAADSIEGGLIRSYDAFWKYPEDKGYAVVDLSLTPDQLRAKFAGLSRGTGVPNLAAQAAAGGLPPGLARSVLNRFTAFLLVFGAVFIGFSKWRGERMFTLRCQKCGTVFCRLCHLGAPTGELCTQCYHLFVVRDGVSGPARNMKMTEIQKDEERRARIFRVLSLLAPGSGHAFVYRPVHALVIAFLWSAVVALAVLAGRVLPVTEAAGAVTRPWGAAAAGVVLLVVYAFAARMPTIEVVLPARQRPAQRRARPAASA